MFETYVPESLAEMQADYDLLNESFGDPKSKFLSDRFASTALLLDYLRRPVSDDDVLRLARAMLRMQAADLSDVSPEAGARVVHFLDQGARLAERSEP